MHDRLCELYKSIEKYGPLKMDDLVEAEILQVREYRDSTIKLKLNQQS